MSQLIQQAQILLNMFDEKVTDSQEHRVERNLRRSSSLSPCHETAGQDTGLNCEWLIWEAWRVQLPLLHTP